MIPEVLKEVSVLLETRVEPGELGLGKLGVSCYISGFGHGERLSAGDDRIHTLMFDLRGRGTHRAYRKCADLLWTAPSSFANP